MIVFIAKICSWKMGMRTMGDVIHTDTIYVN